MRLQGLLQTDASFDQPYWNDVFLYLFSKAQPVVLSDLGFEKKNNQNTASVFAVKCEAASLNKQIFAAFRLCLMSSHTLSLNSASQSLCNSL